MQIVGIALVRNEDLHVEQALRNVAAFCDRIHAVDHMSTDATWTVLDDLSCRPLSGCPGAVPLGALRGVHELAHRRAIRREQRFEVGHQRSARMASISSITSDIRARTAR